MKRFFLTLLALSLLLSSTALASPVSVLKSNQTPAFDEETPVLKVYFFNIHARDSFLLECGGETMLIDCGGYNYGSSFIAPKLEKLGIRHIDYAVNTHPDDDHICGFISLLDSVTVGTFYTCFPEDYNEYQNQTLRALKKHDVPVVALTEDTDLSFGGLTIWTYQDWDTFSTNSRSLVMHVSFGDSAVLFMGDTTSDVHDALAAEKGEAIRADLFKVAHHGINKPTDEMFKLVNPKYAVITNNHTDMVDRTVQFLNRHNCPVLYTVRGCVECVTDGREWKIRQMDYDRF